MTSVTTNYGRAAELAALFTGALPGGGVLPTNYFARPLNQSFPWNAPPLSARTLAAISTYLVPADRYQPGELPRVHPNGDDGWDLSIDDASDRAVLDRTQPLLIAALVAPSWQCSGFAVVDSLSPTQARIHAFLDLDEIVAVGAGDFLLLTPEAI